MDQGFSLRIANKDPTSKILLYVILGLIERLAFYGRNTTQLEVIRPGFETCYF